MDFLSLKRLLGKVSRRFKIAYPQPAIGEYPIGFSSPELHLDSLQIETVGIVRIEGWSSHRNLSEILLPTCRLAGQDLPRFQVFRTYRPDVAAILHSQDYFQGVTIFYRLKEANNGSPLQVLLRAEILLEVPGPFRVVEPHYAGLLDMPAVLHRENIYCSGPPAAEVSQEVIDLCQSLPGPLLDFGCGVGALVKALRERNIEARGIELDREPIVNGIVDDLRDHITLFDGTFPLPFADGQFESVVAVEVIEHLPDFELALSELARITNSDFIMTVPDMSSVPMCFYDNVVPWHLLEGTHVNFFNQTSLEVTLRKYFSYVEIVRIGRMSTNRTTWFVSLAGICRKKL